MQKDAYLFSNLNKIIYSIIEYINSNKRLGNTIQIFQGNRIVISSIIIS